MATEDELIATRKEKAETLKQAGSLPYPNGFHADNESRKKAFSLITSEAERAKLPTEHDLKDDAEQFVLFGRIIAKRGPFVVFRTPLGDMQSLVRKDELSENEASQFAALDLADHALVKGPLMRTRTGDAAIKAKHYQHIGKAQLPPPAKWHGLTDIEKRYRERYVDLFANPDVATVFRARSLIVSALREFLNEREFLEVETPLLHPLRGGATAKPFQTHHNALDSKLYLRIAPELYLKRLLVGGLERVYEIGRSFRNEGISTRHNPEFTMLEFYMAYADCDDLIALCEAMIKHVDAHLLDKFPQFSAERSVDFSENWAKVSIRQSIADCLTKLDEQELGPWREALGAQGVFDESTVNNALLKNTASLEKRAQIELSKCKSYGQNVFFLFEHLVEGRLTQLYRNQAGDKSLPVFITEYPIEVSPLARPNDSDPRWVDRFELFVEGRELANAFSELNDPDIQAERFKAQLQNRSAGDEEAMDFDADYIRALQHGMPNAGGFGLGVDRLVMTLCSQHSIRDVLLFPLLKPETDERA
ncbi:MAG: lysine--tRNA ligase [Myxococcales bacterium]|nr:MAG: lysine--tRNA ligase [Myxococcales bacterium]